MCDLGPFGNGDNKFYFDYNNPLITVIWGKLILNPIRLGFLRIVFSVGVNLTPTPFMFQEELI